MEEPNLFIRWAIDFFAGGSSAIWGAVSLAIVLMLSFRPSGKRIATPAFRLCMAVLSLACIGCGSPPVPIWFWCLSVLGLVTVLWSRGTIKRNRSPRVLKNAFPRCLWQISPAIWLVGFLLLELPWRSWSPIDLPDRQILVIGDSVTAGLNDHDVTWPQLLVHDQQVDLFDASQSGATLKSARKQNQLFNNRAGVLILEIGGNDLLEGLPVADFEQQLNELLQEAIQSDRTVIMFELPLPPFCSRYGAAQRQQARLHGVRLVPKWMFASVLTTKGATVDGIHLSAIGQKLMKSRIENLMGSSLAAGQGNYHRLERGKRASE